MVQALSDKLTQKLVSEGLISKEDIEIYQYGVYIFLMQLISISTTIMIGLLIGKLELTIVFIVVLRTLRQYAGGYHSNKYITCYLISLGTYLGAITLANCKFGVSIIIPVTIISGIIIFVIGSVNSQMNPKTDLEMQSRTKKTRIIVTINSLSIVICTYISIGSPKIWLVIMWSQVIITFSLLIVKIQRRNIV